MNNQGFILIEINNQLKRIADALEESNTLVIENLGGKRNDN